MKLTLFSQIIVIMIVTLFTSCMQKLDKIPNHGNAYELTTEEQLNDSVVLHQINDLFNEGTQGTFVGVDSLSIYYKVFQQPELEKGAIVISSGRTEATIKYKEMVYDLYKNGYSIFILDHRGQGFSDRTTKEYELGHVNDFQDYVDDLKVFYDEVVQSTKHEKIFLLAHSMGSTIGMSYLIQFPNDFDAAAFSSPMLGLGFIQCSLGRALNKNEAKYATSQKPYLQNKESFEKNTVSNCKTRFEINEAAYDKELKVRLGGVSFHWIHQSCIQFAYIFNNMNNISTPCLLFSASEEKVVDPVSHTRFISKAKALNLDIEGYMVDGAKHELLMEQDRARINVLSTIIAYFESKQ